ncbi:hypothetical protein FNF27_05949 [Cafeteria roenbergensis]|uniref:Uncharacterized protein n=2 Tax=Cafeteria roenbergensis TaxID=33653 RepID=A0A5A8E486_CAFRO|nr:hypothetical protein FNF28_04117 [Cafeteria roenbergensis]KAA0172595.1 hypothetical protein FNF27_05949 [Cafeteria roenbergensis]
MTSTSILATACTVAGMDEAEVRATEAEALGPDCLGSGSVRNVLLRIRKVKSRSRAEPVLRGLRHNFRGDADCARATVEWAHALGVPAWADDGDDEAVTSTSAGVSALMAQLEQLHTVEKDDKLFEQASQNQGGTINRLVMPLVAAPPLHAQLLQLVERHSTKTGFLDIAVDQLGMTGGGRVALRSSRLLATAAYCAAVVSSLASAGQLDNGSRTIASCASLSALLARNAIAPMVLFVLLGLSRRSIDCLVDGHRLHPHAAARLAAACKPLLFASDAVVGAAGPLSESSAAGRAAPHAAPSAAPASSSASATAGGDAAAGSGAPLGASSALVCALSLQDLCLAIEAVEAEAGGGSAAGLTAANSVSASGQGDPATSAGRPPLPSASPPSTGPGADGSGTPAMGPGQPVDPVVCAAAAVVRLPALTERLLALLFHPSAPVCSPHAAAFASRALAFACAAPDDRAEVAHHLVATAALCHEAEAGVSREGVAGRLAMAASVFPCVAAGVLLWCRGFIASSTLTTGAVYRADAHAVVRLAAKVAELQPRLAPRALVVLRRALRVHRPGSAGLEANAVRQAALSAVVRIMATANSALLALEMLQAEISTHSLDAGLARSVVATVLEAASPDYTRGFVRSLLLLLQALAARGAHEALPHSARARAVAAARWAAKSLPGSGSPARWTQATVAVAHEVEAAYD